MFPNRIFNKEVFIFSTFIMLKLSTIFAQSGYTDDQGRYIFDAPASIRNRETFLDSPNSINEPRQQASSYPERVLSINLANVNQRQNSINSIENNQQINIQSNNLPYETFGVSNNQLEQLQHQQQQQLATGQSSVATLQPTLRPKHPQLRADVRNCIRTCPTTTEFNPACGNDGISYSNPQKLACAQRCGQDVRFFRLGRCRAFAPVQF